MAKEQKLGLAFQGGSFLAGAIATGVVTALVRKGELQRATAFSGTSAGALVAAMCWRHKLQNRTDELPGHLFEQWMANAFGLIPNEETGQVLKLADRWLLLNPLYFLLKETFFVPVMHGLFEQWVSNYVEPEACMAALFDGYLDPLRSEPGWLSNAASSYENSEERFCLFIGAAEIHSGKVVTIDDTDLFRTLLVAYTTARRQGCDHAGARQRAIRAAGTYMTLALMSSGSLDTVNGLTRIERIDGIDEADLLHRGEYLDGAYSQNPPISPLAKAGVDDLWLIEIFPERCVRPLDDNEKREDRKEELLQNAPVRHQYDFINKLNFWIASERLQPAGHLSRPEFDKKWQENGEWRDEIWQAFMKIAPSLGPLANEEEIKHAIFEKLNQDYRLINTRTIALPADLQALTDAARIVNSPWYLLYMMLRGYCNALDFLDEQVDRSGSRPITPKLSPL